MVLTVTAWVADKISERMFTEPAGIAARKPGGNLLKF